MFPGLTSRWSSPRAWMNDSPSQTWASASQSACRRSGLFCSTCSSSVSVASRPVSIRDLWPRAAARSAPESGSSKSTSRSTPSGASASGSGSRSFGLPATTSHSRRAMPSTNSIERQAEVAQRPLPRHVGIIMDGNGRWAEQRGLPRLEGHRRGSDSVREVTRAARRLGLNALTLYAFSSQNWLRPPDEVSGLMDLLRDYLNRERPEIMENGIRRHAVGQLDRLLPRVRDPLEALPPCS